MIRPKNKILALGILLAIAIIVFFGGGYLAQRQLISAYNNRSSQIIRDREGKIIAILPNQKGYYAEYLNNIPSRFKKLVIEKEDQQFYHHFGFNPWSMIRASLGYLGLYHSKASSTISQQLVKNLLGNENKRNLKNKIIESFYTLALETYQRKDKILKMYANSIYFGNHAQGLLEASQLYFNSSPNLLTKGQVLQLISTISAPSKDNPAQPNNENLALAEARRLNIDAKYITNFLAVRENMKNYHHFSNSYFEIKNLLNKDFLGKELTIDKDLTKKIRKVLRRNLKDLQSKNARNGAVIVIKLPENEVLSLVGSPDPTSSENGYQINMALSPRPIGSTIKPFIYLKAMEKGLRPYTLVDDREYKYITALGFPLYPKNFDYKYRGLVTLHYALTNSLNVPAVKVLEYVGLENFYNFLKKDLKFEPIQDLNNYQLGIALGGLEMDLFDLAKYFTIFPNNGILKEPKIFKGEQVPSPVRIADPRYIQLINKMMSDRKTGIDQFGLKSNLNLFEKNYALKTGTSRDFKDSWVVGFTPDFLVGAWIGNADNTSMDRITGETGAGRVWSEVMEILLNSKYNKNTPFDFSQIKEFNRNGKIEYGLPEDNYEKCKNLLVAEEEKLIISPHDGDEFLLEDNTKITLEARKNVKWFINGKFLARGKEAIFSPKETGKYEISAESSNNIKEKITILVNPKI